MNIVCLLITGWTGWTGWTSGIGAMGEILEWALAAVAGWRFLLSSSFRKAKLADWKNENVLYMIWDVCGGMAGIGFSLLVISLLYEAVKY